MGTLSPEAWAKILIYSGLLGLLILILAIAIFLVRHILLEAAERDKSEIHQKVKLLEFRLRGFRDEE